MHHQHVKRPEQTHESVSDHHIPKHAHAGKLDAQCSGLPLYLQRSQTQLLQRQPLEEGEKEHIQTMPLAHTITPLIQRQPEPEEEEEEAVPEREEESTPILESVPTRDADEPGE